MSTRAFAVMAFALMACADDGVKPLADAPPLPIDAPLDTSVELTVTRDGAGTGTVTSSPEGIACGTTCAGTFDKDTVVTLTAVPDPGSVFTGWSGACTGPLPTCDVTLDAAASVTATFGVATYTVTVTRMGAGTGTVTGDGLACGTTCTVTVEHGTMLSLAAAPGNLSVFAGWGGACSGNGTCMVTVTEDTAISASFALDNLTLFVTPGGNGSGTVTSSPAGINCGADCSQTYVANQMITLTAAAGTGSTFTGWSGGGCTGTSTCTVTMTAAITVTATFTLNTHLLTVEREGNGAGSVTSAPAGIACGTDCSQSYNFGTMVTLTASPAVSSTFTGWSAPCSGTGTCTVTMNMARTVTATFTLRQFTLSMTKSGTGAGSVTGGAVNCQLPCTATVNYGTTITLAAVPSVADATASRFTGWSGGCTGAGACTLTNITANATVNAGLTLLPNLMFVTSTTHNGNLGGLGGADDLCKQRAVAASLPGTYVAFLGSNTIDAPKRVGAASGWIRVDQAPVMNDIGQMGAGTMFNAPNRTEANVDVATTAVTTVWTGSDSDGSYIVACNSSVPWAGTSGESFTGTATTTTNQAVRSGIHLCTTAHRLYCLGVDRAAIAQ